MGKLYYFLTFLWQLPQWILGNVVVLWYMLFVKGVYDKDTWDGVTTFHFVPAKGTDGIRGVSFGTVILVITPSVRTEYGHVVRHELGHSRQSLCLGWLYLPVIGLPSLVITAVSPRTAQKCWFEKWKINSIKN